MASMQTSRVVLAVAIAAALAGCGRSVTSGPEPAGNLEKWVAEVKARPAPPLDPLPVMQQFETFEYAAQALRDPFSEAFSDQHGMPVTTFNVLGVLSLVLWCCPRWRSWESPRRRSRTGSSGSR